MKTVDIKRDDIDKVEIIVHDKKGNIHKVDDDIEGLILAFTTTDIEDVVKGKKEVKEKSQATGATIFRGKEVNVFFVLSTIMKNLRKMFGEEKLIKIFNFVFEDKIKEVLRDIQFTQKMQERYPDGIKKEDIN